MIFLIDFMRIIGIIYLITTVLILMFVKEKDPISTYNLYGSVSISLTVKLVWKVLKLKQIHRLIIFLLTWKVYLASLFLFYLNIYNLLLGTLQLVSIMTNLDCL